MRTEIGRACSRIAPVLVVLLAWVVAAPAEPTPSPTQARIRDRICRAECRQDARSCLSATRQQARLCSALCRPDVQGSAQQCAGNPDSNGCQQARERARTCLAPCAEDRGTGLRACRADGRACIAECPEVEPPPDPAAKDPACVANCVGVTNECAGGVREQANVCLQEGCAELRSDLEETCGQNGGSEGCHLARRAALDCMRGCRNDLREGTRTCARNGESCLRSCPNLEPETPPAD